MFVATVLSHFSALYGTRRGPRSPASPYGCGETSSDQPVLRHSDFIGRRRSSPRGARCGLAPAERGAPKPRPPRRRDPRRRRSCASCRRSRASPGVADRPAASLSAAEKCRLARRRCQAALVLPQRPGVSGGRAGEPGAVPRPNGARTTGTAACCDRWTGRAPRRRRDPRTTGTVGAQTPVRPSAGRSPQARPDRVRRDDRSLSHRGAHALAATARSGAHLECRRLRHRCARNPKPNQLNEPASAAPPDKSHLGDIQPAPPSRTMGCNRAPTRGCQTRSVPRSLPVASARA